jgi:hypothetical protein
MKRLFWVPTIGSLLLFYYLTIYFGFMNPDFNISKDTPILKERLGTTLWHSSTANGEPHVYCYYPGGNAAKINNDYLLQRVNNLDDCQNWHGIIIFNENQDVSEKEKFDWGV